MPSRMRLAVMALAAVIALAASGVIGYHLTHQGAPSAPRIAIGGPIDLTAEDGRRFTNADLGGKPFAVFFGFTRCPNVCPTTLSDLTLDLEQLGPLADKLKVLFVSVDPERDTPETLKEYLSAFDPRITGLSGTPAEIASLAKDYRVFYEKVPTEGGDYTMNHTATVYLMDGKGGFTGTISLEEEQPVRVAKLKQLAENG
ncbi:protein SCO1/2 [Kaistia soli DSM 19436]|uniref:Protein SCO1/2 n=1 Tax=Kaistia soli DSM 19436 TaxID=1122133 RepID=A0A1M4W8Q0_9HYPH|nr:SCO family protein [Kaistia soli]SHE77473.1 protein SCO1/2 [Kaistia soli DSM 19436]